MKCPALHWLVVALLLGAILVTAFTFFRNPGPTYTEVSRGGAPFTDGAVLQFEPDRPAAYPNGRAPGDDVYDAQLKKDDKVVQNDATFGVILPYLATPH